MDKCLIKVDEAFIKSFINIQKNVNRMYGGGLDPVAFDILGETADDPYPGTVSDADIDKLNTALQDFFPHGLNRMIDYYSLKEVGIKISEEVDDYAAQKEQMHPLSKIDFSPVFIREFMNSCYLKDFIYAIYQVILEQPGKKEDNSFQSGFISVEELKDEINGHIHNDPAFREDFSGWPYKKKNQYLKSWQILCFLCVCFIHLYLKENISLPVRADHTVHVRKQPKLGAEVICLMEGDREAVILEDTIRYYKIAFLDGNGIKKEGYVSKKSVKLLNEEDSRKHI